MLHLKSDIILCRSYKLWQRWFSEFSKGQDDHNFTRCEHCAIAFLHKNQIFIVRNCLLLNAKNSPLKANTYTAIDEMVQNIMVLR